MSTTATNRCFWQDNARVPAAIREGTIPTKVGDGEILIKVQAWAVNPVDAYIQVNALPFFKYPMIPGSDIAGVVSLVGSGIASQKFKVGDRVLGLALGASAQGKTEYGGFQHYVVVDHVMASKIPDSLAFAEAAVFPLCIATAANALFGSNYIGMPFPQAEGTPSVGKSVLVWGGASAVGSNAIQLAKAAGFDVVTTCSPRNFEYVMRLGADKVFDYTSPTVIDDVVAAIDSGVCAGIFQAAGPRDAVVPCCEVAARSAQTPFVACANVVPEGAAPEGVTAKFVFAGGEGLAIYYETSSVVFGDFLPKALEMGTYKVAPAPEVVGTRGLDGIQEALHTVLKGVSAKKVVVEAE
ncbi:GroES-like protein [Hypoxylon crocopeplum]|nr:GroES-like protein [Hypoxylon crocopeplum]